ncbi:chromatin assembly factor 1 subunit A-like [Culicoides brevitarsis]|uniref:chromatin assembly factor 1 subunit A-like n=1 Tax=Culicoides brevitarsis TaxID=469753 RepID=UPI00307C0FE2
MEVNSENLISTSPATTPGQKKMKQTRLPFAILSPVSTEKSSATTPVAQDTKKRKLSGSDEAEVALPAAKVGKVLSTTKKKENITQEVIELVDDSEEEAAKESAGDTSSGKIHIKLAVKKQNNKKLKLEKSAEKAKKTPKSQKKEKLKKEEKDQKEIEEPMEVVCLDDDEDDEPKPLEVSILEENVDSEKEEEDFKGFSEEKNLPKPEFQEKSNSSPKSADKTVDESDLDVSTADLNESVPQSETKSKGTPGSGIKKSHKKLSEEEKIKRQQEREEARRLEREAKEALKKQEREAKEAQRLKEKQEKEAKLQKEREEKENQKRLEREEKEKKKQAELEQKQEEKRQKELKKEEERLKKEEEKQKKELEKQQREEEERRKKEEAGQKWKKSAQLMEKFFVPKKTGQKQPEEESSNDSEKAPTTTQNFMPFQVKENMRLAPVTRGNLDTGRREALERTLNNGEPPAVLTYLSQLKRDSGYQPGKSGSVTWQEEDDSQDIIVIDTKGEEHIETVKKPKEKYRAKFLHFHENRRPAYYGTFRKKSKKINGRKPLGVDTQMFDYEVDSDEEWEEEEPGESLHGSDDEKDKDNVDDDYEVDNDFFVPHGHLSDEELEPDGELATEDNSPEAQKARLKIMQQEFQEEHKKKTEKIKPRIIGCIWVRSSLSKAQDQCSPIVWEMLSARAMLFAEPITSIPDDPEDEKPEPANVAPKKVKITEDGMKELIRLVHGNPNSKKFLSDEFAAYRKQKYGEDEGYQEFSFIASKIKEIAEYKQSNEEGPMYKINAWYVKPEILEKYQLTDLPIINTWSYVLNPKTVITKDTAPKKAATTPAGVKKVPVSDEAMPDLIRLVHGNTRNRQFLVDEFRTWRKNTFGHLEDFQEFHHIGSRIKKISEYKKCDDDGPMKGKMAYFVNEAVLKQYGLEDISLPNTWQYHTVETKKKAPKTAETEEKMDVSDTQQQQPGAGPLTKFAVKLTEEERRQSLAALKTSPKQATTPTAPPPQKKRVQLLMSVPRGEAISEAKKNNLISQFLQRSKTDTTPKNPTKNDDDDVMIID